MTSFSNHSGLCNSVTKYADSAIISYLIDRGYNIIIVDAFSVINQVPSNLPKGTMLRNIWLK